jgi:hypothetical protein
MPPETFACVDCGETARCLYYCDQNYEDGPWCGACFLGQRCWSAHPEDCSTIVWDEPDPPAMEDPYG